MGNTMRAIECRELVCSIQSLGFTHLLDNFEVLAQAEYFNAVTVCFDSSGQRFVGAIKIHHQADVLPGTAALFHRAEFTGCLNDQLFPINCLLLLILVHLDAHHEITLWKVAVQSHACRIRTSPVEVGEHFDQDLTNGAFLLLEENPCNATHKRDTSLFVHSITCSNDPVRFSTISPLLIIP